MTFSGHLRDKSSVAMLGVAAVQEKNIGTLFAALC
jgi:hypothetical protein